MSALAASSALTQPDRFAAGRAAMKSGDYSLAVSQFHAQASADAADYEARYWLYSALAAAGEIQLASQILEEARDTHAHVVMRLLGIDLARLQRDRAYAGDTGRQLYVAKLMASATLALGRSLDFDHLESEAMVSYGLSLQHQGRMAEAIDVFTAAAASFHDATVHEFLLYPLFHAPDRMRRVSEEAKRWAEIYLSAPQLPPTAAARTEGQRLRIGYIGPSFAGNQLAQFILPVLEAHDPAAVEVFLYGADPSAEDGLPAHCKTRSIGALGDAEVAGLIRQDGIDILIDVWGHTAGSRLAVFGYRPAPVQVAWINFVQTTGLASMDYVLHADSMDVPGTQTYFTEEIWRIGEIMVPFRPAPDRPDPVTTPALRNGYVTFGSFNNPAKLSDETVAAWAAILCARPNDRLVLKYSYYLDPVLQRVTQARFAAHGADIEQLEFRGHSAGIEYLREFQDIDLALDPSPCPGGTTTCDALSNGVPVLTLSGADFYSRIGLPGLLPCGLPELVADSWQDYVGRALSLTASASALDRLRQRVRLGFDGSAYRDEVGFTRKLEGVFRQMIDRYAAKMA